MAEYVVQIYIPFAPPSARPLLLRLEASTTVQEAVDLAIEKLRREQAATRDTTYVVSAAANAFRLWIAAGDGTPLPRTPPLPRGAVLRSSEGLAFPFMLHLNREEITEKDAEDDDVARMPIAARQVALARREAEVLEQRKKTIEATRDANIAAIEAARRRAEEAALRHAESYDLQRRQAMLSQRQAEARSGAEAERDAAAAERQAQIDASLDESAVSRLGPTDLEDERLRLRLAEERAREAALAAWEAKRRDVEAQKQLQREAARQRQEAERERRMQRSLDSILTDLDGRCREETDQQLAKMDAERRSRAHVICADEDTRTIALVEHRRFVEGNDQRLQRWANEDRRQAQAEALSIAVSNATQEAHYALQQRMDKWSIEFNSRVDASTLGDA